MTVRVEERVDERIAWGNALRKQFSPAGVATEDGSLNQEFFKPKRTLMWSL